mgnify:CR=1 FL=1
MDATPLRGDDVFGDISSIAELASSFEGVVLAGGATQVSDLPAPGRDLSGIYQAME